MAWKDAITLLIPGTGVLPAISRDENLTFVEKLAILRDGLLVIALGILIH